MARARDVPSDRRHSSGRAVVTLPDLSGGRRDFLLGPCRSDESAREYTRVINEWQENPKRLPGAANSALTVIEMAHAFWQRVERMDSPFLLPKTR